MIDPHSPKRVTKILLKIKLGMDLTEEQKMKVMDLIWEYADIFVLEYSQLEQLISASRKKIIIFMYNT